MPFNSKSQVTLSVIFILATAGATGINAQTSALNLSIDKSSTSGSTDEQPAVEKKKSEPTGESEKRSGVKTTAPVNVRPQADPDKWQFQVSPYFHLAGLHGTAGIGDRTTQVDESFSDVFDVLNFAIMGTFEARKGKFISLTDLEYVSVSDEKATPGPLFSTLEAKFKTFIFDPEVGYRVFENPDTGASVDVLGGIRVWHVSTELNFGAGILPAIDLDGSRNWVDAVGGVRGKAPISKKMFLTGKFDLGGGGSKFTYQVFGGGGYGINEKIALIFGYRVLDVNYDKNNFVYDMNQRGPIVGLAFKF